MQHYRRPWSAALLGAALALGALAGQTADAQAPKDDGLSESAEIAISDRQLERFAAAYNAISPLRKEYARRMQQAKGEDEKSRIREAADRDWARVIREQGLTVDEFQTIGRELNARRPLQERLNQLMRRQ